MINNSQKVAGSVTLISWRTHLLFWKYHNYNNWRCRGECVYAVILLALFSVTALVNIETVVITTIMIGLGLSDVEGCSHHCRSRHQDLLVFSPSLTYFYALPKVLFVRLYSLGGVLGFRVWLVWFHRTRDAEFCNWWWTTSSCYLHCSLFEPEAACCSPPCTLFPGRALIWAGNTSRVHGLLSADQFAPLLADNFRFSAAAGHTDSINNNKLELSDGVGAAGCCSFYRLLTERVT